MPATRKDAEWVMGAEMMNDSNLTTQPAGVAASIAAAARLNQRQHSPIDSYSSKHDSASEHGGGITIGEALEATALTAGKKPVEWSDAVAIQAAEVRATGRTSIMPGGVAAAAQSAATLNARATRDEDKTKLANILANATSKLPSDKPSTRKDAEGVMGAEMRNDPNLTTDPAGVAASIAAAARLNQGHK
ncbi:hypothetical protein V6N11_061886 [Hibiscus sabdariffa]|uniref:SMP domain-containing protein n=1 Tax=Hibiscus sabdariffa TaxID=183260 RepID=A0ABR2N7I4_9ROSI